MAKTKFYAVKNGRVPGVYNSWPECEAQVKGFSGATYQSFSSYRDAALFAGIELSQEEPGPEASGKTETVEEIKLKADSPTGCYAFVDGSFNSETGVYGYGGFLMEANGKKHILQGSGDDPELASMRNVAGEIQGSMAAAELALNLGVKDLDM